MDKIVDLLLGSFDFGYMFSINVLTYVIIKIIDTCNGVKAVPVWLKRIIALLCGVVVGVIVALTSGYSNTLLYSFILSLVTWDNLFKPLLKKFQKLDYKQ